jgi:hypothetical protein
MGYYVDFVSAVGGLSFFPIGYLFGRLPGRLYSNENICLFKVLRGSAG